jgi:hypothetical protein
MSKVTITPKFEGDPGKFAVEVAAALDQKELRVRMDDDLQRDLTAAKAETGIRSDAEVVRHALRRLAKGGGRVLRQH